MDVARWIIASDLYINVGMFSENSFLNEVPMADYLDQVMLEDNSPVSGYIFTTPSMNWYLVKEDHSKIADYSM